MYFNQVMPKCPVYEFLVLIFHIIKKALPVGAQKICAFVVKKVLVIGRIVYLMRNDCSDTKPGKMPYPTDLRIGKETWNRWMMYVYLVFDCKLTLVQIHNNENCLFQPTKTVQEASGGTQTSSNNEL